MPVKRPEIMTIRIHRRSLVKDSVSRQALQEIGIARGTGSVRKKEAAYLMGNSILDAADLGRDTRESKSCRLGERHAEAFSPGRHQQNVAFGEAVAPFCQISPIGFI